MKTNGVLLDTSFFLRFLNEEDNLFKNANDYYKYFLNNDFYLVISTIAIAEYCAGGNIDELPLKNIRILPFNVNHAIRTGEFAKLLFKERKSGQLDIKERNIIPNDSKLFAQADVEVEIKYFVTSDTNTLTVLKSLNENFSLKFETIDINIRHSDYFGILDFK